MNQDPLAEIIAARHRAAEAGDALVDLCFLATADTAGAAHARTLVLRQVTPAGLGLVISRHSPKWEQIETGGSPEILILWSAISRQYRLRGHVTPMPEDELDRHWRQKSHGSRLLDLYYEEHHPQSTRVATREELVAAIEALRERHPTRESVRRPESTLGLLLVPEQIECWHGSPEDRLHDRWLYRRATDGNWMREPLVP